MKISSRIVISGLILVLCAYQAPNLTLLAYKAGLPLVDPSFLGVQVKVRNGWYPIATNGSLLGKAVLSPGAPPLVAFHRPSLLWPWRGEVFAVMAYSKPVVADAIELTKDAPWGRAMLIKANPTGNPAQRLFAVPDLRIGILVDDSSVVDDIVALDRVTSTPKVQ